MQKMMKNALLLTLFSGTTALSATVGTWVLDNNGDWFTATNWSSNPTVPNAPGDTAQFTNAITAPRIVTLSSTATISNLNFDSSQPYTLSQSDLSFGAGFAPVINVTTVNGSANNNISVNLINNSLTAALQINQGGSSPLTINGNISDPSSLGLTLNGPGTLILTGINVGLTGPINLNNATLSVGSGLSLGPGTNTIFMNGATLKTAGSFSYGTGGSVIFLAGGTDTFDISGSFTLNGVLANGGGVFNKTGSGTMTVATAGSNVVVANIQAGTLNLPQGSFSAVAAINISSGASITNSTYAGNLMSAGSINNSGTINAASSTFTTSGFAGAQTSISGTYTQSSSGTLVVNYNSPTSITQYLVNGGVNLAGTLQIHVPTGVIAQAAVIPLLQSTTSLSGTFNTVLSDSSAIVILPNTISYAIDPNTGFPTVFMTITPGLSPTQIAQIASVKNTQKTTAIQNYYNYQIVQQNLHRSIWKGNPSPLLTSMRKELKELEDQLQLISSGKVNGGRLVASNTELGRHSSNYGFSRLSRNPSRNRLIGQSDSTDTSTDTTDQGMPESLAGPNENLSKAQLKEKIEVLKAEIAQQESQEQGQNVNPHPHHVYGGPSYTMTRSGTNPSWDAGLTLGYDYAFPSAGLGGMITYDHSSGTGFINDTIGLTVYSSYVPPSIPQISLSYSAGTSYTMLFTQSQKMSGKTTKTASGRQNSQGYNVNFGFEYTLDNTMNKKMPDGLAISPTLSFVYQYENQDTYREHGAGSLNTQFKGGHSQTVLGTLQVALVYSKSWDWISFLQSYTVGWQRQLTHHANNISFKPAGSHSAYIVQPGQPTHLNSANASIDYQVYFFDIHGIEASWTLDYNQAYHSNRLYLAYHLKF